MLTHNKNCSLFDAQPPRGSSRLHIVVPTLSTPYYPLVTSIDIIFTSKSEWYGDPLPDFRLLKLPWFPSLEWRARSIGIPIYLTPPFYFGGEVPARYARVAFCSLDLDGDSRRVWKFHNFRNFTLQFHTLKRSQIGWNFIKLRNLISRQLLFL